MIKFPNTKIRTLQFDSFFIQCIKKVQDTRRMDLLPNEAYWLYRSETYMHDFVAKATLDTKIAILAKLGFHYSITVYDDNEGCSLIQWNEQIRAAKGLEGSQEWFKEYTEEPHSFIIGSYEVRKILNRLEVMYHSKLFQVTSYITRLRDMKRVGKYDAMKREDDFIHFMMKVALSYTRIPEYDSALNLNKKELVILLLLYLEHRFMSNTEIDERIGKIQTNNKTGSALITLCKKNYVEKSNHPYNYGSKMKKYSFNITEDGMDVIRLICVKILGQL